MEPAMAVEDVAKRYGETVALDGVSLAVEPGEVLALVGPNGAGKTTLVRVLTGTAEADSGTATLLGTSPADVDRDDIGVLPQSYAPPDRLTARELVRYYAGLYESSQAPDTVLDTVGVADVAETRYGDLSGGQQRRVCLGTTLVNDPTVLVLDEPTTGIDPAGRRRVRERIDALADRGRAVLVTTHDMDEAERLADRVALLAAGSLRATGTPRELIDAHGGDDRVVVDPAGDASLDAIVGALESAGFDAANEAGRIVVEAVAPADIAAVVGALEEHSLAYDGLEWRQPTLEDAYMALAGDEEPVQRAEDGATPGQGTREATDGTGGERR